MRIKWVVGMVIILSCIMPMIGVAEQPAGPPSLLEHESNIHKLNKVAITPKSDEKLPLSEGKLLERYVIRRGKENEMFQLVWKDNKPFLKAPEEPPVELPPHDYIRVSRDGSTILRIGEKRYREPPYFKNIYWLNSRGKQVGSLVDYYSSEENAIGISDDGYTAVGGRLLRNLKDTRLGLYSPVGEKLWEVEIERGYFVGQILVGKRGKWVAAILRDATLTSDKQNISTWDENGVSGPTYFNWGFIQEFFLLENGNKIFVQSIDRYGLIDIYEHHMIWQRPGKVNLLHPQAAMESPDGEIVFLLLRVESGENPEFGVVGSKILRVLDASTGDDLLLKPYHLRSNSYSKFYFQRISLNEIQIIIDDSRLTFHWTKQGGHP